MNRTLFTWLATFAMAACLFQAASAQSTIRYDWTSTPEFRTTIDPFSLTPEQRSTLITTIRTETGEVEPIFLQERAELMPILTPEQLTIYDSIIAPQHFYSFSLLRPEDWVARRQNLALRLNLTPDQRDRYFQVVSRSDSALTPIVSRYETQYTTVLTPEQWVAYRTGITSGMSASSHSEEASSSSSSVQSEEYRRVYRETTVQTSAPERPVMTTAPAAPVKQTRALNWRNQDRK